MAKVIVIGSGIGGIASALRLAAKGHKVSVYEANDKPGGKLAEIKLKNYRFDAGPSLFTLPNLVEDLFTLSGKNIKDYFNYFQLDEICNYFFEDGTEVKAYRGLEKFASELNLKLNEPVENVINFLNKSEEKYNITENLFLKRSLHKFSTWFNNDALKGYLNIKKLEIFKTMNESNMISFENPKTVQLFNRYATYNGSDPFQTPATLNIIPHLEYNLGAYFPLGGMYSIIESLYTLAVDMGVEFYFNTKVTKIIIKNKRAEGIIAKNNLFQEEKIESDIVISNVDVVNTYKNLLQDVKPPQRLLMQPKSTSALIFYWGIKKSFSKLGLHNIFFSKDYKYEFEKLFIEKTISDDPTVYINITSKLKPDDAPLNCENWFTMINTPNNSGQNWDQLIKQSRENIIKKLSIILGTDIESLIDCEQILDPRLIESNTGSWAGALYGNSSNNKYAAFLRHANFSSKIKNLYFVGGSVHPGGGIPLALSSAKITIDLIK